ncbi:unnamed protein product [Kuraishia capsulata CBS 1993]|uniref:NADP-dependent oxidoreductase domain-containing protein n=1 Tax=Kuraishia capsulata CBS 1993 TaxID=1382522 RepID=W6MR04_9ASCO|nr:uncharacterized protein KUCA_T00005156001 [Kuraishia capsulata CBS 1993]CDK29169.1 unnamed protein product [Kuraishia capsulata CBS 1993]
MVKLEYFTLPSGDKIPGIGFGSGTAWQHEKKGRPEEFKDTLHQPLVDSVYQAIETGFRHLDTAEVYTTHPEIGAAINKAIDNGLVKREDIWLTDKFFPGVIGLRGPFTSGPYESLTTGLEELKLDYVDLYLIHNDIFEEDQELLAKYWKEMEQLVSEGKAKNIGISNFSTVSIETLLKVSTIKPAAHQFEYHPYLPEQIPGSLSATKDNGLLIEAYAPLLPLTKAKGGPLDPIIPRLAEKYGRSDSLILLRYAIQKGALPLTTSSKLERIQDVIKVFEFELEDEDVKLIEEVGKSHFHRGFINFTLDKYNDELKKDLGLL